MGGMKENGRETTKITFQLGGANCDSRGTTPKNFGFHTPQKLVNILH